MTKKEMFNLIATVNADNEEIVNFCNREIELLTSRASHKTPTKTQKENEGLMDNMVDALAEIAEPVTVTDLIARGGFDITNQKASALLRKLVDAKRVVKTIEKKKAFFSLA